MGGFNYFLCIVKHFNAINNFEHLLKLDTKYVDLVFHTISNFERKLNVSFATGNVRYFKSIPRKRK